VGAFAFLPSMRVVVLPFDTPAGRSCLVVAWYVRCTGSVVGCCAEGSAQSEACHPPMPDLDDLGCVMPLWIPCPADLVGSRCRDIVWLVRSPEDGALVRREFVQNRPGFELRAPIVPSFL
jgi:hypothetical protein